MADAPILRLCDFLGPTAEGTHLVKMKQAVPCCSALLSLLCSRGKHRLRDSPACTRPQRPPSHPTAAREQLDRYAFQLSGKNTAHLVNSRTCVVPDVSEEVGLMAAKPEGHLGQPLPTQVRGVDLLLISHQDLNLNFLLS